MPAKFPCPGCKVKGNITFTQKPSEPREETKGQQAFIDPTRVGRIKTPDGFKDVLRKVSDKYPGNKINI